MIENLGDLKKRYKNKAESIIKDTKTQLKYVPDNYAFIYRDKIHIKLESKKYEATVAVLDVLEQDVYIIMETAEVYPVELRATL